jgi:hypothetical protein
VSSEIDEVSSRQGIVFAYLMGRKACRSPAETLWDATRAFEEGDITKEQWLQVVDS